MLPVAPQCAACGGFRVQRASQEAWRARVEPPEALLRCRDCGLRWISQDARPDRKGVYEDTYCESYGGSGAYAGGAEQLADYLAQRLNRLTEINGGPGRLLEVGCGSGLFLVEAGKRGWRGVGVEISQWAAEEARKRFGLELVVGDFPQVALPAGEFDAAHLNHVLEHLPDPAEAIKALYRLLRPGGHLVVEVPNEFDALYDRVRWCLLRRYDVPPVRNPHLYFFSVLSLRLLLQEEGFELLEVTTPRRNVQPDSRLPLGGFVKRLLYRLEARMRRGPNVVVVARKPASAGDAARQAGAPKKR